MTDNNDWNFADILEWIRLKYEETHITAYWSQENPAILEALKAISAHAGDRFMPTACLGVGGSGIVLRLTDCLFLQLDKALKFPRPVPGKVSLVAEMLTKEMTHLSDLRHPGIVAIVYHAILSDVPIYESLPYYIMECVDGTKSQTYVRASSTTERDFQRLVLGTAESLAYLHTHRQHYVHLDIKPDNIVVRATGEPVIIDLGTCKSREDRAGVTAVAVSRPFAHPELVRRLAEDPTDENRSKGELPRQDIAPAWDLWSFGLTLLDWLGTNIDSGIVAKGSIYHRLAPYSRKYYFLLAARLLTYSLRGWLTEKVGLAQSFLKEIPVNSVDDLLDALVRLQSPEHLYSRVPEMRLPATETIQAAPSVHVSCTPAVRAVLTHRLYRRLNSITQLGVVCQVYPNARHARREHSLGTYANTVQMVRCLASDVLLLLKLEFPPVWRSITPSGGSSHEQR